MSHIIFGPDGLPLNSADYARPASKKPLVGEVSVGWGSATEAFYRLGGDNVLRLDTSRLTLRDYRMMRDHYQINASLSILTFQLHQLEYTIECDGAREKKHVEENLDAIWTRLVRGLSQAFWAGYSPMALQWENDVDGRRRVVTKVKDLQPESCQVHWKKVTGVAGKEEGESRRNPQVNIFDGIDQQGYGHIPVTNCAAPETPVLMQDFTWKKAGDLVVGDEILAFDEEIAPGKRYREYRKAVVEANGRASRPCLTVETRQGDPITVSADHKFLVRRDGADSLALPPVVCDGKVCPECGDDIPNRAVRQGGPLRKYCSNACMGRHTRRRLRESGVKCRAHWEWVEAGDLRIGDKIAFFGRPFARDESREAGYVAGVFDGEGSLSVTHGGATLSFAQRDNELLRETVKILESRGFEYRLCENGRDDCYQVVLRGGRREIARFMEVFDPRRLRANAGKVFEGSQIKATTSVDQAEVSGVYDAGEREVAVVQTSTRTLITEGYFSHNCLWYPLLMENGDYYGRKLLKAAYQPWYFSLLNHVYTNRYFERFGEPVPIGRAPYDDVKVVDGKEIQGNVLLSKLMGLARSGAAVVLPNDKIQSGMDSSPDYEYTMEYLECVDAATEILTATGWKTYDQLQVGDLALTLNNDTGLSEWQPVQKVNVHEAKPGRVMLRMEGQSHSSLTTLGHRWPTLYRSEQTKNGKKHRSEYRRWRESRDLTYCDSLVMSAPRGDLPTQPKYDDAFVELVAWYWTEGHLYASGNYVCITQKKYPEELRGVLTRLFGPAVKKFPRAGGGKPHPVPLWREGFKKSDPACRLFFLNHAAVRLLHEVAPEKIVTHEFLLSLTQAQLELYIRASMLADGNPENLRANVLMQKSRAMAEQFQFACTLAGRSTSIYQLAPDSRWGEGREGMWCVSLRRKRYVNPKASSRAATPFTVEQVEHDGVVWCPTTENQTWLARRRGTVYFTGNSQMRGADFERYLARLDEEISLSLFMPISAVKSVNEGYNSGVAQLQVFYHTLNAIAADWAEYIDKYLLAPMVLHNFGPKAKLPRIRFKRMGAIQQETMRAILTSLTQKDAIKFDLEQLGKISGLNLSEVQELTEIGTPDVTDPSEGDEDNAGGKPESGSGSDPRQRPERVRTRGKGADKGTGAGGSIAARSALAAKIAARLAEQHGSSRHSGPLTLGHYRQIEELIGGERVQGFITEAEAWIGELAQCENGIAAFRAQVERGLVHQMEGDSGGAD